MATPSGASSPTGSLTPSTSVHPSIVPAPYAENDQHVCFICLQNENDTPDATWVHPCPCTLEAHQDCMLQWVAEMEVSNRRSKNGLQCPACKSPITVEEPYDAIVALRNRFNRKFSRISPGLLVLIVSECSVVGAASYGFAAITVFAGRRAVASMVDKMGVIPTVITCSLIGPGLVLSRWLASLGNLVVLPVSALVSSPLMSILTTSNYLLTSSTVQHVPNRPQSTSHLAPITSMGRGFDAERPIRLHVSLLRALWQARKATQPSPPWQAHG